MPQNGCRSVSVSQRRTPTDQTSLCGLASPPASRSGAMYASVPGYVSDCGERVRAVELRKAEVEQAHGDLVAILEQDVRRLDVAVDDPGAMCVRERVEHLRGDGDGVLIRIAPRREWRRASCGPGRTRTRCRRAPESWPTS